MSEIVLQTFRLSKRYGSFSAVEGLDLAVQAGEVFGFLGPNGAGKTTTIGMILGLLHPTSGKIRVFGQEVSPNEAVPLRKVGSLVGEPGMAPHLSGRENLRLLTHLHPQVNFRRVEEVLEQVGLAHAANRPVHGYSLGMRQRLGLGAALLHRPALLILDEPTNGLDPAGMKEIRDLLHELPAQGVTVFLSSHLLHEVEQVCDRVAVLHQGRVAAIGKVDELLAASSQVVRARVPSPVEAAAVLRTLPGVVSVEPDGRYVTVKGVASEQVNLHLVEHGIVPGELTSGSSDLETVFFALTENSSNA